MSLLIGTITHDLQCTKIQISIFISVFENNGKTIIVTGSLRSCWTLNKQKLSWETVPSQKQINNLLLSDRQWCPHPPVFPASVEVQTQEKLASRRLFLTAFPKTSCSAHRGSRDAEEHNGSSQCWECTEESSRAEKFPVQMQINIPALPHNQCWCVHNSVHPRRVTVNRKILLKSNECALDWFNCLALLLN